jgi:hypothetical protein
VTTRRRREEMEKNEMNQMNGTNEEQAKNVLCTTSTTMLDSI